MQSFFIVSTLFIPMILTSILPLRWVWRLWALICVAILEIFAFQVQPSFTDDRGLGWVMGVFMLTVYGGVLSFIIACRLLMARMRKKKSDISEEEVRALLIADICLASIFGLVVATYLFKAAAFALQSWPYGFSIHATLILISAAAVFVTSKSLLQPLTPISFKYYIFSLALSCGLLFFSVLGLFHPYAVTRSAIAIADERPYCIALNSRFRQLNSLEDLTLLTMDKGTYGHHAYLLVEGREKSINPYHWSYLQSKFIPGLLHYTDDGWPPISCRPEPDFTKKIPLVSFELSADKYFYFQKEFIKIPAKYSPEFGFSSISLAIKAPDFEPVEREKFHFYPGMEIRSRKWIESLYEEHKDMNPTGKIGNLVEFQNATKNTSRYYRFDNEGVLEAAVGCYSTRGSDTACQHRFYRNGAMYSFEHSRELLSKTEEMENNLFNLFESFKEK